MLEESPSATSGGASHTCGLVLGEVALRGEEGGGQQLSSTPRASSPVPHNHQLRARAGDSFASQQDNSPDFPTLPPIFQALGVPSPLPPTSRLSPPTPLSPPGPGPTILAAELCGTCSCSNGSGGRPSPSLRTPR